MVTEQRYCYYYCFKYWKYQKPITENIGIKSGNPICIVSLMYVHIAKHWLEKKSTYKGIGLWIMKATYIKAIQLLLPFSKVGTIMDYQFYMHFKTKSLHKKSGMGQRTYIGSLFITSSVHGLPKSPPKKGGILLLKVSL